MILQNKKKTRIEFEPTLHPIPVVIRWHLRPLGHRAQIKVMGQSNYGF